MEFFAPYKQKKIYIRNHTAKSPLFYKSLNMMGAVFTVNLDKVIHLLPKTLNLIPLTLAPFAKQRAIIGIYCFEYKETDIGPYNEFSIALALNPTKTNFLSAFEIIKNIFIESHHGYVLQMPVTTEIAYWGGVDYFNFPKYITNIQFEDTLTTRICNVYDRNNQKLICSLEGEKISIKKNKNLTHKIYKFNTYSILQEKLAHASFLINPLNQKKIYFPKKTKLTFGDHEKSLCFKNLDWSQHAIQYIYAPDCEGILFEPELN